MFPPVILMPQGTASASPPPRPDPLEPGKPPVTGDDDADANIVFCDKHGQGLTGWVVHVNPASLS